MDLIDVRQLALQIQEAWARPEPEELDAAGGTCPLPSQHVLERLLSLCYRASLMQEELRPVTFRLLVCEPGLLPAEAGPPLGLHRLLFVEPRGLSAHELRRLSPAAKYARSLVGVEEHPERGLSIWGIVHSGPRWMQEAQGGRDAAPPLPQALVIHVTGPGRLAVSRGRRTIFTIDSTRPSSPAMNVFGARWLIKRFADVRAELMQLHAEARQQQGPHWPAIDENLSRLVAQQMLKRLIATIQAARHGATLLIVPTDGLQELSVSSAVRIKYEFVAEEPRNRFRTLMVRLLNALAETGSRSGLPDPPVVTWQDYELAYDRRVAHLDESIFEMSHMIAALSQVDGAVVITKRLELLGFGAEIGTLVDVPAVARSMDCEGSRHIVEATSDVGTRHRSAYRFCNAVHDALAIVISQDGEVRFTAWNEGYVMYWNHDASSPSR